MATYKKAHLLEALNQIRAHLDSVSEVVSWLADDVTLIEPESRTVAALPRPIVDNCSVKQPTIQLVWPPLPPGTNQ